MKSSMSTLRTLSRYEETYRIIDMKALSISGGTMEVTSGASIHGSLAVPGDKSIAHRAIMVASLAPGKSLLRGLPDGDDVARTVCSVEKIGVGIDRDLPQPENNLVQPRNIVIEGGRDRMHPPSSPLDMGNSGTGMRLMVGLLSGFPWTVEFIGDQSLSKRPMDRIAIPLGKMGAVVTGHGGVGNRCHPPLVVVGGHLRGIDYAPPEPSAQVKATILFAGLSADGTTTVREHVPTRRHTEEIFKIAGIPVRIDGDSSLGRPDNIYTVSVNAAEPSPFIIDVPGDPSQAAFFIVAASILPESELYVGPIYLGQDRTGFIEVLKRMGADLTIDATGGELMPLGYIKAGYSRLNATKISAEEVISLVDEVPILAIAAAVAEGVSVFEGLGELRVKESNRLEGTAKLVNSFGGDAHVEGDNLIIRGTKSLEGGEVDAHGDHRIAMAATVAGLAAVSGDHSIVTGYQSIDSSYPGFVNDLSSVL